MLDVLTRVFPQQMAGGWKPHVVTMVPSYGQKINDSPAATNRIRRMTSEALRLPYIDVPATLTVPAPAVTPAPVPPRGRSLNLEQQAL